MFDRITKCVRDNNITLVFWVLLIKFKCVFYQNQVFWLQAKGKCDSSSLHFQCRKNKNIWSTKISFCSFLLYFVFVHRPSLFRCPFWHWAVLLKTVGTLSVTRLSSRAQPRGLAKVSLPSGWCRASSWYHRPLWWSAAACCLNLQTKPACSQSVMNTGEVSCFISLKIFRNHVKYNKIKLN